MTTTKLIFKTSNLKENLENMRQAKCEKNKDTDSTI